MPPEFSDVNLMMATGWTWHELEETPAEIVRLVSIHLVVKDAKDNDKHISLEDWPE
tara:strand:- start:165 stop:332 length:168 start_codon:yes stop_codon:yes gene_type:complete